MLYGLNAKFAREFGKNHASGSEEDCKKCKNYCREICIIIIKMKKSNLWFSTIVMCVMCVICISCSEEEEEPYLILKPVSISLKSTGEASEPLVIESNSSWKVTTNESWLTPSKTEGNGNAIVDLKADPNPWERDRKVSIIVTAGRISKNLWITQGHDEMTLSGDVTLTEEEGASGKFNIQANREWSITDVPDWLELSDTRGTGDAEITVTATQRNYEDEPRSASLKVVSGAMQKNLHVKQANTYVTITSGSTLSLKYSSGNTGKFFISTNGSWKITEIPSWLKVSSAEGSGDREITVTTKSSNLTEDERSATMKITVGLREAEVTVKQAAGLYARINAPIVLSDGCYLEYDLGAAYGGYSSILYDASYFDSQTEESIYSEVKDSEKTPLSERNYDLYSGLPSSRALVICMVPYRKQSGEVTWGSLHTMRINTSSASASSGVTFSNTRHNNSEWLFTISTSLYSYYLLIMINDNAVSALSDSNPAVFYAALMYRENMTTTKSGQLALPRSYSDYALCMFGWGGPLYHNVSRTFDYVYASPQRNAVIPQSGPKFNRQCKAEFIRMEEELKQCHIVKVFNTAP